MTENEKRRSISWLHISDLHAGQKSMDWMWPTLRANFYDDLARLNEKMNGWDLVVFSGDLTQKGTTADFAEVEEIVVDMWKHFESLGSTPKLFIVPGNHDLERPDQHDPMTAALKSYWTNDAVRAGFWDGKTTKYADFITEIFSGYIGFLDNLENRGVPLCRGTKGLLPGDSSCVISANGVKLGLVGLNSTFLHLFDSNEGSLDVNARQLHAITANDPDGWCASNDLNFLVTHHPASWLEDRGREHFYQEIHTRDRFSAHLFGHMHAPDINRQSRGGSGQRNSVQAASLCGLRHANGGKIERIHGYSGGSARLGTATSTFTFWPRVDAKMTSGSRRFVPDRDLDLTEDNNFSWELGGRPEANSKSTLAVASSPTSLSGADEEAAAAVPRSAPLLHALKPAAHHSAVRRLEQSRLKTAIEQSRSAWLVSDWGYGTDEFIWTVMSSIASELPATYRISLQDYRGRDDFFARFQLQAGLSFQEFCKSIGGTARALVVLEDTPVSRETVPESSSWESEILLIVDAIREYCANSIIVLVSRQAPKSAGVPSIIEIKPLDEPDVRSYVVNHPAGGEDRADVFEITDIYRLSGGLPTEIDSILRELEFISLPQLIELRLTSPDAGMSKALTHGGVEVVIGQLRGSSDPEVVTAYDLLRTLTVFPYGETLMRIQRFNPKKQYYPSHVAVLSDRGLIEAVPVLPALKGPSARPTQSPKLVAKKAVRDHVMSLLSAEEKDELSKRAASIYFGEKWAIGEPHKLKAADLAIVLGVDGGLGNPHAVINSLLSRAVDTKNRDRFHKSLKLARIFVAELQDKGNYRNCVTACRDFVRFIAADDEGYVADRNSFSVSEAIALRMLGEREEAHLLFERLGDIELTKRVGQQLFLNWALARQNYDDDKAKELAEHVVSLGKGTFQALQAKSIILELSPEDPDQMSKLAALEKRARGKKAFTTANNIAYFIAQTSKSSEDKKIKMKNIAISARKNGDNYSAARAVVALGTAVRDASSDGLTNDELSMSIEAYHYFYKERMDILFANIHRNLWAEFVGRGQTTDLLRLFRHSSLIWRLNGDDSREKQYINELAALLSSDSNVNRYEGTELGYFVTRMDRLRIA